MPSVLLNLPEAGDYLVDDGGAMIYVGAVHGQPHLGPTGIELDSPEAAHEFYREEACEEDVEWVHPRILRGRILTTRDIDNDDAHEGAVPGDTTYDSVTDRPEDAARELRAEEIRTWEQGPVRTDWRMTPTGRVFLHPDQRREHEYTVTVESEPIGTFPSHDEAWAAVVAASKIAVDAWKAAHPEYAATGEEPPE